MADRIPLGDFLRDLPDADLVWSWNCAENELSDLIFTRDAHRGELLRRITDSGKSGLETDKGTAVKEPQFGNYEWDVDALNTLILSRLTAGELAKCVTPVPATVKVNTVGVKAAAARLGVSEAELAGCFKRPELTPKLKFVEPERLLETLQESVAALQIPREAVEASL